MIRSRKFGQKRKYKRLPFNLTEREGMSLVRALAYRSKIKSKAMVRRRGRGDKYCRRLIDTADRIPVVPIAPFERWQFGSDAPLGDVGYRGPLPSAADFYPVAPIPKKQLAAIAAKSENLDDILHRIKNVNIGKIQFNNEKNGIDRLISALREKI